MAEENLKRKVAVTIKWNVIDKVASQLLYAVTGIVLARMLSHEDFGLVGAMLVFQAFATLFVDSGFSYALIQRKSPTRLDYSTILWFNLGMAVAVYLILFFAAPLIADCFGGDERMIPLSRVMFLSFIVNATAIVQTNRLMKQMDVKMIAVSNSVGLIASAVVGITLAVTGYGAWAIVWQTITLAAIKSIILWGNSGWRPLMQFSWQSLRSFVRVGSGVMGSSFLNVLFQNIYAFFIGHSVGLAPLGYYTQADKWSKMGIASLAQVLTSSFLPVLSKFQDDAAEFKRVVTKMNRVTAYLTFPAMGMLIVLAPAIFHTLFGTKWDDAIPLFQILLVRGVFTVLQSLYNNYVLALGRARLLVFTELLRDGVAVAAIVVTLPFIGLSTPANRVLGLEIFLAGQLAASVVTWAATLWITARLSNHSPLDYIRHLLPYLMETLLAMLLMIAVASLPLHPLALCLIETLAGMGLYMGINAMLGSKVQRDAINHLRHKEIA
jgi:hypothetical protein